MDAIRNVLVTDAQGRPSQRHRLVASSDWDQIRLWSDKVYMPYSVSPLGKARTPDSLLDATSIGHFTLSRFKYGIPVNIKDFSPAAGTGMILTTLRGSARHWSEANRFADTGIGDAFVVDNSRTHYWVDFDENHLQVNLTFAHDALAALHERWFGRPADERQWVCKFRFGGAGSSWIALLEYVCKCLTDMPEAVRDGPLGRHLEEMIGIHLLTQWRAQLDQPSQATQHRMAPRHVLAAERYMRENAQAAPTLSELASVARVSVRTLSAAFREYRGCTPMAALREQRLQSVRGELLLAGPGATVRAVAELWGYANFGLFAANYKKRFGELPSATLSRRR
ncbi:helix-turn-helix transcriptional regulator [Sulfuritalea sp.]|uniref:AraC family transcriptional regulator n=1 Tax=Sulfuritalea sp. TaxID=2480090 RepID=UPI00286E7EAD|nr:helix-turn-helix transcriptional regulator [Sulfuritalea sp.]